MAQLDYGCKLDQKIVDWLEEVIEGHCHDFDHSDHWSSFYEKALERYRRCGRLSKMVRQEFEEGRKMDKVLRDVKKPRKQCKLDPKVVEWLEGTIEEHCSEADKSENMAELYEKDLEQYRRSGRLSREIRKEFNILQKVFSKVDKELK